MSESPGRARVSIRAPAVRLFNDRAGWAAPGDAEKTMPKYLLLMHDSPEAFRQLGPEEIQRVVQQYRSWGARLQQAGALVGSNKLTDGDGRLVRRDGGSVRVTDGPYAEAKEVLGGYFLITAASYDEAIAQVQDCPHLDWGTIEIRQVEELR
jgi:hypothetical protein